MGWLTWSALYKNILRGILQTDTQLFSGQ
jgi:hypothetical protein